MRHALGPGADLYVLPAQRFRTAHLLVAFEQTLAPETVTFGSLLPRVLRRGTRRWPDMPSLAGHLEDLYGSSFGAAATKLGDLQVVEASFSCPGPAGLLEAVRAARRGERQAGSDPAGNLTRQGAVLLAETFQSPVPAGVWGDYVAEEKDGLARDIASVGDDRMSHALYRCVAEMCTGEPNSLHSLGRAEDLEEMTPDALERFRCSLVSEAPIVAYLAGPADDAAVEEIEEALAPLVRTPARARRPVAPSAPHPRPSQEREVVEAADVEQARLVIGVQTGTVLGDPDYPAQVLYNGLLGGFVSSRLFRRIREEAGLAYYAWSRLIATKGIILISCGIQEANYGQAVELIRRELDSLAKGDFTDTEFEGTRNSVLALAKALLDTPSGLMYGHLELRSTGHDVDEIAPWRLLQAVTPDQVRDFGRKPALDTIYLLGKQPTGRTQEARPTGD